MKNGIHIYALMALALCIALVSCAEKISVPTGEPQGVLEIAETISTKSAVDHIDHASSNFPTGSKTKLVVDYYSDASSKSVLTAGSVFTKTEGLDSDKVKFRFKADNHDVRWLSGYKFDLYAVYPHDVALVADGTPVAGGLNDVCVNVDTQRGTERREFSDGSEPHVSYGVTIYNNDGEPASNPIDLLVSDNVEGVTLNTDFSMHNSTFGVVPMTFRHKLSRLQISVVNGNDDDLIVKGIAIYPQFCSASYGVKSQEWRNRRIGTQTLQNVLDGDTKKWKHYTRNAVSDGEWTADEGFVRTNPADIGTGGVWNQYYSEAPICATFEDTISNTDKVEPLKDSNANDATVEFMLLPDCGIDCIIMNLDIKEDEDQWLNVYMPVSMTGTPFDETKEFLTQEGHLTQLVLGYNATLISLLHVYKSKTWLEMDDRYFTGKVTLK